MFRNSGPGNFKVPRAFFFPGAIPVALDEQRREVHWLDVGQFHFYQGFFAEALRTCAALQRGESDEFVSPLDDLPPVEGNANNVAPTAFIFHAGRCGSTLLVKVLARSREHLVFGEAAPHNQIWNLLPPDREAARELYRRLITAMGRRRLPSYRAHIIKFTSFNILEAAFIREAFPDVPSLFLFRRPDALLASWHREAPAWMGATHKLAQGLTTPEAAVEAFFRAALSVEDENFQYLDYDRLNPESLPGILRFLRLTPPAADFPLMLNEFSWNSKSGVLPAPFAPKPKTDGLNVPPILEDLYNQLRERSNQRSNVAGSGSAE